jgi:RecJ-like exonuclease
MGTCRSGSRSLVAANTGRKSMICQICHGKGKLPGVTYVCPECGGCGISHCCSGEQWSDFDQAIEGPDCKDVDKRG